MLAGIKAWWRGLTHLNHRGYVYVWANVLWFVLSLPLITAPAAWAGLVKMSHLAYQHPSTDIHTFWEAFKAHLKHGLLMALLNALIIGINLANLIAYAAADGVTAIALRVLWISVLFVWFAVQFYMWPLFFEMQQPSLIGAMRNAFIMLVLNPFFTLGLWLGILLLIGLSTAFGAAWLLLTGSALAAIANSAVLDRLEMAGYKKRSLSDSALLL